MSPIMMEVIEWFDQTGTGIVQRYPEGGSGDIKMGAQLIVRENQAAVFFRDGQGLDVLGPGRHTLSTQNLPILTRLLSLPWGFQSPFRAEVYRQSGSSPTCAGHAAIGGFWTTSSA
jgi:membrane protease subunit (stomatin/prohibitin family)